MTFHVFIQGHYHSERYVLSGLKMLTTFLVLGSSDVAILLVPGALFVRDQQITLIWTQVPSEVHNTFGFGFM